LPTSWDLGLTTEAINCRASGPEEKQSIDPEGDLSGELEGVRNLIGFG
jgi:hypothetical protein